MDEFRRRLSAKPGQDLGSEIHTGGKVECLPDVTTSGKAQTDLLCQCCYRGCGGDQHRNKADSPFLPAIAGRREKLMSHLSHVKGHQGDH